MNTDNEQQLQVQDKTQQPVQVSTMPHFTWPSSKPGPRAKQPPPGQRSMKTRTEQMVEIGYNQEAGTPSNESLARSLPDPSRQDSAAFDQQDTLKKRKKK